MTDPNISASAAAYRILREQLLEQWPELADDETTLLDTLEGMTTVHEQLAELVRSAVADEELAGAIMGHQERLAARRSTFVDRAARKRRVALHIMADLGIPKIVAADLTISRRAVAPAVVITDEAALPDRFVRVTRSPDKAAIKAALKSGGRVAGAELGNGGETLHVKI